jgi:diadenosine tetraphosphate (Ap4A) HIT family hydrolase
VASGAVSEKTGRTLSACVLCGPLRTPVLGEGVRWRVALNLNQNLLGKCIVVLRRHEEQVTRLTSAEWADLHEHIRDTTARLRAAIEPDHFNYAFLQNQDRHVHLHIIPRYAGRREFGGMTFEDPDYPGPYAVPSPVRPLAEEHMAALAATLQPSLARPDAS